MLVTRACLEAVGGFARRRAERTARTDQRVRFRIPGLAPARYTVAAARDGYLSSSIAGVNAGYPFTYYNSCLAAEYAAAARTGSASLYINTGYDPTYTAIDGRHTTQDCATGSQSISGTLDQLYWTSGEYVRALESARPAVA